MGFQGNIGFSENRYPGFVVFESFSHMAIHWRFYLSIFRCHGVTPWGSQCERLGQWCGQTQEKGTVVTPEERCCKEPGLEG